MTYIYYLLFSFLIDFARESDLLFFIKIIYLKIYEI